MTFGFFATSSGLPVGDHHSVIEHQHPVADAEDGIHLVLDPENRDPPLIPGAFDDGKHVPDLGCVQPRHGLVEQGDDRGGGNGAGDLQEAPVRQGEVRYPDVLLVFHLDKLQGRLRPRLGIAGRLSVAVDRAHHDVFEGRHLVERLHELVGPRYAQVA